MKENPSYENFDLDIKNNQELEEAKEKAGVKSELEAIGDTADHAIETDDERLFENAVKIDKELRKDLLSPEKIKKSIEELVNESFPKEKEENKKIHTNRAFQIYSKEKNNKPEYSLEDAVDKVKKEIKGKQYTGDYIVNKGGTVDILKKNSEEKAI